ncbi:hypothetical protein ACFYZ2_05570 [Streptomyces sviceus]|uniref:hypothetical protein n=1 Tax=Streptomyces sviceus TaxID=285530 RepID=UPI00368F495D
MTLLLTHGDLEALLEPETCLDALRDGFLSADADADGVSIAGQRVRTDLPFPGTATALIPGLGGVRAGLSGRDRAPGGPADVRPSTVRP